jgi:hypothetical protein
LGFGYGVPQSEDFIESPQDFSKRRKTEISVLQKEMSKILQTFEKDLQLEIRATQDNRDYFNDESLKTPPVNNPNTAK